MTTRREIFSPHPEYPPALGALPDPPASLHVEGVLGDLRRTVAIVGTRRVDEDGVELARSLASDLARAGCTIVSGGAAGIDAAAHEGALEAGGRTVAVLAGGLDQLYPARHRDLFARIREAGALVSEHDDAVWPDKFRFLYRNRIIAALGVVTVVVQAPLRSGALSTAAWARKLGRPVFAVPHAPWDPRGEGCLALLRAGAAVCTRARDVLVVSPLGGAEPPSVPRREIENTSSFADLDATSRAVLAALGARPRYVDEITGATGLPAATVQRTLLALVLRAEVVERGVGRYARAYRAG